VLWPDIVSGVSVASPSGGKIVTAVARDGLQVLLLREVLKGTYISVTCSDVSLWNFVTHFYGAVFKTILVNVVILVVDIIR
jgi:hypothetical protein